LYAKDEKDLHLEYRFCIILTFTIMIPFSIASSSGRVSLQLFR
jgi:hypothetical protein